MISSIPKSDPDTFRSRLLGMLSIGTANLTVKSAAAIRDLFVIWLFGRTAAVDAYFMAYAVPAFLTTLLIGSLPSAWIPAYLTIKRRQPEKERQFRAEVWGRYALWLMVAVMFAAFTAPFWLPVLTGRLDHGLQKQALGMLWILLGALLLNGWNACGVASLHAESRFVLPTLVPIVTPVAASLFAFGWGQQLGMYSLAWGVLTGAALEAVAIQALLRRHSLAVAPSFRKPGLPETGQVFAEYRPMVVGAALLAAMTLVDQAMASRLGEGSVTALTYATRIPMLLVGVAAMAVGTVILPYLSRLAAAGERERFRKETLRTSLQLFVAGSFSALMLMLCAHPLVKWLFEHGSFREEDTVIVAEIQSWYVWIIPFYLIGTVTSRALSAAGRNAWMLRINAVSLAVNIAADYALMLRYGISGLAAASVVVYGISSMTKVVLVSRMKWRDESGHDLSASGPWRVAFLIRSLRTGGAERQLVMNALSLRRQGMDTAVFVLYPGGELESQLEQEGVPVYRLFKKGRWDVIGVWIRLRRQVYGWRPDAVYSFMNLSNILACSLTWFRPGGKRPKIYWGIRDAEKKKTGLDSAGRLLFRLERLLSQRVSGIAVNSFAGKEYRVSQGFASDRLTVIPNGIDTALFVPGDRSGRIRVREQWGLSGHVKTVGIVGRLDPVKDHETFLYAAAQLPDAEEVRFIIIGAGKHERLLLLQQSALELGLTDKLVWAGERHDMPSVYGALDFVVSSSITEGFSNSIGEAMACGIPCVVTDVGDSARIVGPTGWVVPPGNPSALAAAIREALDSKADRSALCRARVVELFGTERLAERTERWLRGEAEGSA